MRYYKLIKILKFYFIIFCIFLFYPYSNLMANEEAKYQVISINDSYEVRKYSDRFVVETISSSNNGGFRKLFRYISGDNDAEKKIKMTVPVTRIEKEGNIIMQFYLPAQFDHSNAPNPLSNDVKISKIEGGYYAVLRYSGRASDDNFIKHKDILKKELNKNNIIIKSLPIRATYNSPYTLPAFRRNEAMFKINYN